MKIVDGHCVVGLRIEDGEGLVIHGDGSGSCEGLITWVIACYKIKGISCSSLSNGSREYFALPELVPQRLSWRIRPCLDRKQGRRPISCS